MENEIKININIGTQIRSQLTKMFKGKKAPPKVANAYNYNESFTQEELDAIKTLVIYNIEDFKELNLLPNLEDLSIISTNDKSISNETIENFGKLKNLKSLKIKGCRGFDTLNINDLSIRLQELEIISCHDLCEIIGLNKDIVTFTCVDNTNLRNKSDIALKSVRFASSTENYKLDITYAPIIFDYLSHKSEQAQKDLEYFLSLNLKFGEVLSRHEEKSYSFGMIKTINKKAQQISDENIKPNQNTTQKFASLYNWICKNVKYDHEAWKKYKEGDKLYHHSTGLRGAEGNEMGTNSSLNAFLINTCVCEGYSRALQYLCELNHIKSNIVNCHVPDEEDLKDEKNKTRINHAMILVNFGDKAYYCDPTWDADNYHRLKKKGKEDEFKFDFFFRSKEEMEQLDHSCITSYKDIPSCEKVPRIKVKQLFDSIIEQESENCN